MTSCPFCKSHAILCELQAIWDDIENGQPAFMQKVGLLIEFGQVFQEIAGDEMERLLTVKTCVRVINGKCKGKIGVIHGSFDTRRALMEMGLTKTTVRFENGELEMLLLENLVELTTQEKILLGLI